LTFKRDGAVAMTDREFDDWNSSRSSLSLSPTLQDTKIRTKAVSRMIVLIILAVLSYTNKIKLHKTCVDVFITSH
jgi:hypothetical protein